MGQKSSYLTSEDMQKIEAHAEPVRYRANDRILSDRAPPRKLFWLREGSVRVELSRLYQNAVLSHIGPGEIFGEMSFLDRECTCASVLANSDVVVLEISDQQMEDLLAEDAGLAARFYHTLAVTLTQRLRVQSRAS